VIFTHSLEQDYDDIVFEEPELDDAEIYATYNEPWCFCDEIVLFPQEVSRRRRYEATKEKVYSDRSLDGVAALYQERKSTDPETPAKLG